MADGELQLLESSGDAHGTPADGAECLATMEDITAEDGNYCEYQTMPSGKWHPALYSADVVKRFILKQYSEWLSGVKTADCEADLKRRLGKGPPIWVEDKHGLPIPEDDTHISRVWMAADGKEYSAKLQGCVEVRRPRSPRTPRTSPLLVARSASARPPRGSFVCGGRPPDAVCARRRAPCECRARSARGCGRS